MKLIVRMVLLLGLLWPGWASAAHFLAPVATTGFSDWIGTVQINGVPAQPGDEVAVYDPQGVLCGLFVVTVSGQYGVLHIYGDDLTTPAIDEGAVAGDVLSVRVWSAAAGVEYSGANVQLIAGNPVGTFVTSAIPPVWQPQTGYALNIVVGTAHFADPIATPFVSNLIGSLRVSGSPAHIGDEVALFDPQGVLSGHFVVTTPGQFGIVQIYGDDPNTVIDEGAIAGDILTIRVWDSYAGVERSGTALRMLPGVPLGSFVTATLPLVWQDKAGQVLDLYTSSMDIDGDGQVLATTDGQLMMRWMFGARGAELITGAVGVAATRTTAAAIETYITDNQAMLDVDDNGSADALTDGILVLRYLNGGYTGITLTDQALAIDAKRTLPADITAFLASLM